MNSGRKPMAALALMLMASVAWSASEPDAPAAEPTVTAPPRLTITAPTRDVQLLFDLDLRRWPEERFYENMTGLIQELSMKHGAESVEVLLSIAELYIGQMMLPEAGSVLESIEKTPVNARRLQALIDAQRLLSGKAIEALETSPLTEETRPDHGFWKLLHAVATVDPVMLNSEIEDGIVGLVHQTRPVARTVLPIMIEAMIETRKLDLAAQALRLLEDFPELTNAPIGDYLRGRAAQKQENNTSALQAYFKAAKGFDRYAVRARLAIAEMALEDGGRGALLAATDVLEAGLDAWRGDEFEVAALQSLARVYEANGDHVKALITHSKLLMRYPGSDAAELSLELAAEDLHAVYQAGMEGQIPLSRWLAVHKQLVPAFRYYPEYAAMVDQLAGHLLKLGGTTMAAAEYERALKLRLDLNAVEPGSVSAEVIFQSHLNLVSAYIEGRQYMQAKEALAAIEPTAEMMQREKLNALQAKVAAGLGDTKGLLRTHVATPSVDNLRNVSRALWEEKSWPEAVAFYSRLWAEYPGQFDLDDATYLLIAAHKSEDSETVGRVAGAFPNLTQSEDWARLAESFLTAPPDVTQLTLNAANGRLNRLNDALSRLEGGGL